MKEKEFVRWENLKDWIRTTPNFAEEFIKNHEGEVYLYGGGRASYYYQKYLASKRIPVKGIIETNPAQQSTRGGQTSVPVYSLDEFLSEKRKCSIVIAAPKYLGEIEGILLKAKYPHDAIYGFEAELYYSYGTMKDVEAYRNYILSKWNRIQELRQMLADKLSVDTLKAFLQGRVSGDQRYFIDVMVPNQYYPKDILSFNNKETLVECGSYNGDTLHEFIDVVHGEYEECYCFEPDAVCADILQKRIAEEWKSDKIHLIKKGAWDEEAELCFESTPEQGTSCITSKSENRIPVVKIDDVVNGKVSFLKMDIEGAELRALTGAKEVISTYRPKLAICVYHEREDFLAIPEWLHALVPQYRFYLRHHNWGGTETVLYAVCE